MTRLPSFKLIETFLVAAQTLSFTATAAQLHITPPAVSRRIQALEAELGTILFRREHRSLELTTAGKAYAQRLTCAVEAIHQACDTTRAATIRRSVRVSVRPSFAMSWLLPRIRDFNARYGSVLVELETSAHDLDLSSCDVGIRLCDGKTAGLHATPLLDVNLFPVCSPAYAREHGLDRDLARLTSHHLLGSRHLPHLWPELLQRLGLPDAVPPQVTHFDGLVLSYEAAAGSLGVALGMDVLVQGHLEQKRLVALSEPVSQGDLKFHALVRPKDRDRMQVRAFVQWLQEQAAAWRAGRRVACAASQLPANSIACVEAEA